MTEMILLPIVLLISAGTAADKQGMNTLWDLATSKFLQLELIRILLYYGFIKK